MDFGLSSLELPMCWFRSDMCRAPRFLIYLQCEWHCHIVGITSSKSDNRGLSATDQLFPIYQVLAITIRVYILVISCIAEISPGLALGSQLPSTYLSTIQYRRSSRNLLDLEWESD